MKTEYIKRLIDHPAVRSVASKVLDGHRLTLDEGVFLMKKAETSILGLLARERAQQQNIAFANRKIYHIALFNSCLFHCSGCKYSQPVGQKLKLSVDLLSDKLAGATETDEIVLSSGIHPQLSLDYLVRIIQTVRTVLPDHKIKALRAIHLVEMARKENSSMALVLETLKNAGLNAFLGGDALIFRKEMRSKLQDYSLSADEWIAIHKQMHQSGFTSEATMMYGHFESVEDRLKQMNEIRELQDETLGFDAFIPVKFQAETGLSNRLMQTSSLEDVRVFAVARIFLDNVRHVDALSIIGGEGWEEAFKFGVNRITTAHPDSDTYLPQYGELAIGSYK
ncbi:MAG: hypothetical protein R6T91_00875 [Bacteroidales bacterium]